MIENSFLMIKNSLVMIENSFNHPQDTLVDMWEDKLLDASVDTLVDCERLESSSIQYFPPILSHRPIPLAVGLLDSR